VTQVSILVNFFLNTAMNKMTKTLSFAVAMFAITGMTGAFSNQAFAGEDPNGFEGCSPGHWKNDASKRGEADWDDTVFDPDQEWDAFFTAVELRVKSGTPSDPTLEEALNAKGGKINALAREAVAALLNASHPDIDYEKNMGEIIALVNAAISDGSNIAIENARAELRPLNHLGEETLCPLTVG